TGQEMLLSHTIFPLSGMSIPPSNFNKVDFPAPFRPIRAIFRFGGITSDRFLNTYDRPVSVRYHLVISRSSIIGPPISGAGLDTELARRKALQTRIRQGRFHLLQRHVDS